MIFGLRSHAASRAALLVPALLAAAIQAASAAEPSLSKPLAMIEAAFRSQQPDPLTPLLPQEGKIYLSLDSLGGGVGYFSRDQVYFILGSVLTGHQTISFTVKPQKTGIAGNKQRPDSALSYCVGSWAFHHHDGTKGGNQIFFVLSMRKGVWSLVEIREAQ